MDHEISDRETVSEAVVLAVAEAEGCVPTALDPLTETVDPDALDDLFNPGNGRSRRTNIYISFIYSQSQVTIARGGCIEVSPRPTL